MRAGWCEPGTAIVAGPSLPEAPDLFLGWAFQVKRRWGRAVVIDEDDREWHGGVTVIPPGEYRLCTAVQGLVRYPAARLQQPLSPVPEPRHIGFVWPTGIPGRVAGRSSPTNEKDTLGVYRTRPSRTESGAFSS